VCLDLSQFPIPQILRAILILLATAAISERARALPQPPDCSMSAVSGCFVCSGEGICEATSTMDPLPDDALCQVEARRLAILTAVNDSADPVTVPDNAIVKQVFQRGREYLVVVDGGAKYIVTTEPSLDGNSCRSVAALAP
jgi:hypothetical protein